MLKAIAIITVLLLLCVLLVIFWSACSLSGQISRMEEERERQRETAHSVE